MPYFSNLDENDEDESNPNNQNSLQLQISGASPTSDATGSTQSNQKSLNTGSGYQNLDKYLNVNNAQEFGNQFVGKVGNEINSAEQGMKDASDKFKRQVTEANYLPSTEQVNSALANPSQANAGDFQNWQKQDYKGYNSLAESPEAYNQYWSGVNQANTSAKLLGTSPGRFTLLDSYFGRPNYSFGEKSLDNLLVQRSGLGDQQQDLQKRAAGLNTTGQNEAKELAGIAGGRKGEVERNVAATNDAYNQAVDQAKTDSEHTVTERNAARLANQNQFKTQLSNPGNPQLSQKELDSLGLQAGQQLYRTTPEQLTSYYTPNDPLSAEQVVTPEQRARLEALSQLAGTPQTYLGQEVEATPDYTFRSDNLKTHLNAEKSAYERRLFEEVYGPYTDNLINSLDKPAYDRALASLLSQAGTLPFQANKEFNIGRTLQRGI